MVESLFEKNGSFFLLDYSPSHSELVIRQIEKNEKKNIDIFFKGVTYINLKPKFEGLRIEENKEGFFKEKYGYDNQIQFTIIDDSKNQYVIVAYYFCVSNNKLNILETSIGDVYWSAQNSIFFTYP